MYPVQQPPAQTRAPKQIIFGYEPANQADKCKQIEYQVEEFMTSKGTMARSVEFFKPYLGKNKETGQPEYKHSWNFFLNERTIRELVDRINHLVQAFFPTMGQFVLMNQQAAPMMAAPTQYTQPAALPAPSMLPPVPPYPGTVPLTTAPLAHPVPYEQDTIRF